MKGGEKIDQDEEVERKMQEEKERKGESYYNSVLDDYYRTVDDELDLATFLSYILPKIR